MKLQERFTEIGTTIRRLSGLEPIPKYGLSAKYMGVIGSQKLERITEKTEGHVDAEDAEMIPGWFRINANVAKLLDAQNGITQNNNALNALNLL